MIEPLPAEYGSVDPLNGSPVVFVALQRLPDRAADIETMPGAAVSAVPVPVPVALHLVAGVEAAAFDQAGSQAERHGSVIRPLPRLEVERTAANHVGQGCKGAARRELDAGPDRVASGKSEQAASESDPKVLVSI